MTARVISDELQAKLSKHQALRTALYAFPLTTDNLHEVITAVSSWLKDVAETDGIYVEPVLEPLDNAADAVEQTYEMSEEERWAA
jgi:hypothetical protein